VKVVVIAGSDKGKIGKILINMPKEKTSCCWKCKYADKTPETDQRDATGRNYFKRRTDKLF